MTGPLDRPADPSTTPPMPDEAVEKVWHWLDLMASSPRQNPDWPLLTGVASLLREIDRVRAIVGEFADIWTGLSPDQRTAIRRQSEELYNAMGVSATQRWLMATRKEA